MTDEPAISSGLGRSNPYEGRWRWWYSAIADQMIARPGITQKDIAVALNKSENTISMIVNTDLYKDYFAKRKAEWARDHDMVIRSKLTEVSELALDAVKTKLESQRDKIDLPLLTQVLESSLDRLGFTPQSTPTVQVNTFVDNSKKVVQLPNSVTARDIEEARMIIRAVQAQRILPTPKLLPGAGKGAELEVLPAPLEPEDENDADTSADS